MLLQTRVIIVRGLPQNITDDTVLNYFENTRRSGGGAVEEVKIEGSVARVEFESSEGNLIKKLSKGIILAGELQLKNRKKTKLEKF